MAIITSTYINDIPIFIVTDKDSLLKDKAFFLIVSRKTFKCIKIICKYCPIHDQCKNFTSFELYTNLLTAYFPTFSEDYPEYFI